MKLLFIILFAAGMWALQYLFRDNKEEENQRQRRLQRERRRAEGDLPQERARPQRQQGSDLDRFLAEARRRRQSGERAPAPSSEPILVAEVVDEDPRANLSERLEEKERLEKEKKDRKRREAEERRKADAQAKAEKPMPTPRQSERAPPTLEELLPRKVHEHLVDMDNLDELEIVSSRHTRQEQKRNQALLVVAELFAKQDGIKAGMILREIFSPPLSRRDHP